MVNIYKLKLTILQQEIVRLLSIKTGKQLNQRQIANLLEVSQPAVMKAIPTLEKEDIILIKQDKETKRWAIELNRNNPKMIQLKRSDNLRLIYETGLLEQLEEKFAGSTILLFGSYSRGEDTAESDIDIAIIGRKPKQIPLDRYEKLLERTIYLHFYESLGKTDQNLRQSIINGITLSGTA